MGINGDDASDLPGHIMAVNLLPRMRAALEKAGMWVAKAEREETSAFNRENSRLMREEIEAVLNQTREVA